MFLCFNGINDTKISSDEMCVLLFPLTLKGWQSSLQYCKFS